MKKYGLKCPYHGMKNNYSFIEIDYTSMRKNKIFYDWVKGGIIMSMYSPRFSTFANRKSKEQKCDNYYLSTIIPYEKENHLAI